MRKYFLALTFITLGIILVLIGVFTSNKETYTDTVFAKQANTFQNNFTKFLNQLTTDIHRIKNSYPSNNKINDTSFTKKYFLEYLSNHNEFSSLIFSQNNNLVAVKQDAKSLVYTAINNDSLDIVKWQRFSKDFKLISTWEESFDQSIKDTDWYQNLLQNPNEIHWLLKTDIDKNSVTKNEELYLGYAFQNTNAQNILLFRLNKEKLIAKIDQEININQFYFKLVTTDNRILQLGALQPSSIKNDSITSLTEEINNHFSRFSNKASGIYNFKYGEDSFWNAFNKFPKEMGIDHYLITVSNKNIETLNNTAKFNIFYKIALLCIFIGVALLFIKMRMFYEFKGTKISDLSTILKEDESRFLEFKSSLRWDIHLEKVNTELEKVILKTIAAFGNTDGGILLIGVDDDKNIIGLDSDFKSLKKQDADYFEIHLRNLLHQNMGVKYVSKYIRSQFEVVDGKTVCKIKVLRTNKPLYLKFKNKNGLAEEKFFVRSGNSSQEIKSIAEINDYIHTRFHK